MNDSSNITQKVCQLSKLHIEDANSNNSVSKDFDKIINFVKIVKEVNTQNIQPLKHPYNLQNQYRNDIPKQEYCIPNEKLSQISPQFESGFFIVSKII